MHDVDSCDQLVCYSLVYNELTSIEREKDRSYVCF